MLPRAGRPVIIPKADGLPGPVGGDTLKRHGDRGRWMKASVGMVGGLAAGLVSGAAMVVMARTGFTLAGLAPASWW